MLTLLSDEFAPVTSTIGFMQAPLDVVAADLARWREEIRPGMVASRPVGGTLHDMLHTLEPLTVGAMPRELLIQTLQPNWTAYVDCNADGSDIVSALSVLTRTNHYAGLAITSIPHTMGTELESPGRYGAVQFQMFGAERTHFLNYVRTISVTHDGTSRWEFEASGEVQPFEDEAAYRARRVRDRFTSAMLARYCQALDLKPFDPAFYASTGVLVETTQASVPRAELSLAAAQSRLGINPAAAAALPG